MKLLFDQFELWVRDIGLQTSPGRKVKLKICTIKFSIRTFPNSFFWFKIKAKSDHHQVSQVTWYHEVWTNNIRSCCIWLSQLPIIFQYMVMHLNSLKSEHQILSYNTSSQLFFIFFIYKSCSSLHTSNILYLLFN